MLRFVSVKRAVALVVPAVLVVLASVGGSHTASASGPCDARQVVGLAVAPNGLSVRSGPGSGYTVLRTMAYHSATIVQCYQVGQSVNGDPYWDVDIESNGHLGFISDYWLDTGGNITGQVDKDVEVPGIAKAPSGLLFFDVPGGTQEGTLSYNQTVDVAWYYYEPGMPVNGDPYWDCGYYPNSSGTLVPGCAADYWIYTGGDITQQVPRNN